MPMLANKVSLSKLNDLLTIISKAMEKFALKVKNLRNVPGDMAKF